jgi:NAD(P)-dependent dehydrogenase (short-subunit alcohol dehydrogenase family)
MAYSVTKAAGIQLVKCLAATQGPKIRVNAILPGLLLTDWVSWNFKTLTQMKAV